MTINTIEAAIIRDRDVSIPFSFNGAGLPVINAMLSGDIEENIVLDTGASSNLLDYELAKRLELNLAPTGEKGDGAGGLTYDMFII